VHVDSATVEPGNRYWVTELAQHQQRTALIPTVQLDWLVSGTARSNFGSGQASIFRPMHISTFLSASNQCQSTEGNSPTRNNHPVGSSLDRCHTCDKGSRVNVASMTGHVARCVMARRTVARLIFGIERCSILCDFDARQSRATKSQVLLNPSTISYANTRSISSLRQSYNYLHVAYMRNTWRYLVSSGGEWYWRHQMVDNQLQWDAHAQCSV